MAHRISDSALRVLPTPYAGYIFRSRTEARWAVFLDHLDVKWEYEREGFELDGERYLPDFWLPGLRAWVEVKGSVPTEAECRKAQWLAAGTQSTTYIAFGEPRCPDPFGQHGSDSMWMYDDLGADYHYLWCECPICGAIGVEFDGRAARLECRCLVVADPNEDKAYNFDSPRLRAAYDAARTAFTGTAWRP